MPLFFLIWPLFRPPPKRHFEINWPLVSWSKDKNGTSTFKLNWISNPTQVLRSNISYLILVNLVARIKLFWNSKVLCNNCLKRSIQLGFLCIKKMVLTCHSISRQSLWSSYSQVKVHIFWEGHKILRNLHLTFVLCSASQK